MAKDKIGRDDWARAGLVALGKGGLEAVAVEPLARHLGVTKGSFYWHYRDRAALVDHVLELWESRTTGDVIDALADVADPRERLTRLFTTVSRVEGARRAAYLALAAAAPRVPAVAAVLERVSARRIAYLTAAYRELGFAPPLAQLRALLAYGAYVGVLHLAAEAPGQLPRGQAFEYYVAHVIETFVPKPDSPPRRARRARSARR